MFDGRVVNVMLQGGAFAVLVVVTSWLMYWIPKWVSIAAENHRLASQTHLDVAKEFRAALADLTASFVAEQKAARDVCERHHLGMK